MNKNKQKSSLIITKPHENLNHMKTDCWKNNYYFLETLHYNLLFRGSSLLNCKMKYGEKEDYMFDSTIYVQKLTCAQLMLGLTLNVFTLKHRGCFIALVEALCFLWHNRYSSCCV